MIKICLITCYGQPDYIRARTLRAAFRSMDDVQLIVIKNTHTNLLRYPETMWRLIVARFRYHPDLYFQTFRAYESFPFFRILTIGRPFIFDEFINPIEQVAYENNRIKPGGIVEKVSRAGYKLWLNSVNLIATDTPSHAQYSAQLMKIPIDKYVPLMVSTDEQTFKPRPRVKKAEDAPFTVFFYGLYMIPLHGLDTILQAMSLLKEYNIELILIGGKESTKDKVKEAQQNGVRIDYKYRVAYEELADYMNDADLCLGGPFGGTVQSQFIVGGKTYQFLQTEKPVVIGRNHESYLWKDKENALIVDQANPRELADAILWAREHPVELEKIAKAGKELYVQKFSIEQLADQLRLLFTNKHIL